MKYSTMLVLALVVGCAEQSPEIDVVVGEPTSTVAFNAAGSPTVEFNAPDMMCPESCGAKVKEILSEQPGAKEVVINFEAKTATVAVDQDKFDPAAAIAALKDFGFDHSSLKSDDGAAATPAQDSPSS